MSKSIYFNITILYPTLLRFFFVKKIPYAVYHDSVSVDDFGLQDVLAETEHCARPAKNLFTTVR